MPGPDIELVSVEDDLGVDLSEILNVVNSADVFVVMFHLFERRLLVDARTSEHDLPLIRVVDRVRSSDERFRELMRLRPKVSSPEKIIAFQWPRTVRTLVEAGAWQAISDRLSALGVADSSMLAVLHELQWEERREEIKAVKGEEPYRTLKGTQLS